MSSVYLNFNGQAVATSAAAHAWLDATGYGQTLTAGATATQFGDQYGGGVMNGGTGDDTFYIMDGSETINVTSTTGVDTVYAWTSFTLPTNVNNITLEKSDLTAVANSGNDLLIAGGVLDTLVAGSGSDVMVDNGSGGVFFQVGVNATTDVIYGFQTSGTNHDIINLSGSSFSNFTQLQSHLTQSGADALLTLSSTEQILIRNTQVSALTASDFGFNVNLANVTPTFDDEFNSLSLWNSATNTGTWKTSFISGNQTGATSWMSRTLQPNNEQEIYVDPSYAGSGSTALGLNPFSINNGVLDITASKTPTADLSALNNFKYTSGLLTTEKSFSQTYGYFEMKAELPSGQGVWPAFWMLPADGSWPPELDVMEQIGGAQVYQTAHSVNGSGTAISTGFSSYVPANSTGFHTYGVLWTPKTIAWYVDGVEVASTATPADMNKPMYMLVNLAVGGNWPGSPSANFTSAQMLVDYVRAYSLSSLNLGDGSPPATIQAGASTSSGSSTPSTTSATPPTSVADSYSAKAGQALSVSAAQGVLANDTDHNGQSLTATLAANGGPQHGVLTLNADGSFTYTANAGYAGTDSFTYVASDSSSTGSATTVTLTIGATAPTSHADTYATKAGSALTVTAAQGVLANDVDNNGLQLTASLAQNGGPQHGVLTLNADGSFTYTPTAGYAGTDSFTYIASDSLGASTATTVTLNVGSTAPTSHADTYAAKAGAALSVSAAQGVLTNDVDGNGLQLTASLAQNGGPAHGTLTLNADGSFTYTPTAGYAGTDSFTYIASDGLGSGTPTTVTLNVGATAPTSHADAYGVKTGVSITEAAAQGVLANDVDGNGLQLTATLAQNGGPQHGTLALNADGSFTYTPNAGYAGTDSFTYIASDSLSTGTPTTVTLNVGATPIVTHSAAYTLRTGSPLSTTSTNGVLSFDTDSNGLTMTASLAANGGPAHGALTLNADGSFTYTPTAGYIGADSFTYVVSDGATTSGPVTVGLKVVAAPPQSHTDYYSVQTGSSVTTTATTGVLANDVDPNGLALTTALASGGAPAHGTLSFNADGSFVYTPNKGYVGTDSFKYVASDSQGSGQVTTVNLTVTDSAPAGNADVYSMTQGTVLKVAAIQGVLANDVDHNGLTLVAAVTTGPSHGTVTLDANGSFTYTPNAGFVGTDTFKYTPSDSLMSGYGTLVTINVGATSTSVTTSGSSSSTTTNTPTESSAGSSVHVATSSTDHSIGAAQTVDSAFSYSLAGLGAKTLVLTGNGNLTGTANAYGDHITANSGNDVLIAGAGNDTLTGGSGTDTFVFKLGTGSDTVVGFSGHDVIDISAYKDAGYTPTLSNVGYNTEISFSNGDHITLLGINKSMLLTNSLGFTH